MHMKRVLIGTDDDLTLGWVRSALHGLDLTLIDCPLLGIAQGMLAHDPALVIVDGGRSTEAAVAAIEQVAAGGVETRLLLMVEPAALSDLRLPVRVPSDFFVRGASSTELASRARNLLWPGEEVSDDELIRVDDLTLNLATYQAHIAGKPVDFTYLEYALFSFLATHPGRTYSREALLKRVWATDYFGGSRTVDVHVRRVRAKIGPELSRRLETVRSVGYLWNA